MNHRKQKWKWTNLSRAQKDNINADKRALRVRKREMKKIGPPTAIQLDYATVLNKISEDLNRPLVMQEIDAIKGNLRRNLFVQKFFEYNCNASAACVVTGISRGTFNQWLGAFPEFSEAITEAHDAVLDFAEAQLIKNIGDGKETSLIFFLCNKGKGRGWQSVNRMSGPTIKAMKFTIEDAATGKRPTRKRIASTVSSDKPVSISAELIEAS